MTCRRIVGFVIAWVGVATVVLADPAAEIAERARRIHANSLLFDGHNDLPWSLRKAGDVTFANLDLSKRLAKGQTDIPRLREGGLKAQFWSVFIPHDHPHPAQTVIEQIDIVNRMAERYPNDFELAYSAADIERIVKEGKIASLIGIEGGVAIEGNLALLRAFYRLGARYMTLTHNTTLDWADAAVDLPKSHGLSPFGERVVLEMNRLGMLVDISHVSAETMADVLRVARAPVIASHSSAFAIAPSPRNVPDDILRQLPQNGGVVMVNFYSGFVVPEAARRIAEARKEARDTHTDPEQAKRAFEKWSKAYQIPRGTISDVADHIDHIVKVAGIDHVGIGSDFDGITSWPVGLEDVSCYPKLTEELIRRGYSDTDIAKILGGNALRAFRQAGEVAAKLKASLPPAVDQPKAEDD